MTKKNNITQSRLKELLHYNPETGIFTWAGQRAGINISNIAGWRDHNKPTNKTYIRIKLDYKCYRAHRLAWLYIYGVWPENQIDHINQNSLDNRICNLRDVTASENKKNSIRYSNNLSGITGVTKRSGCKKWLARIRVDGKLINLGSYNDLVDAGIVRYIAERRYNFHQNHGA